MKVAQITTTITGGAGIAAIRLNEALKSVNVDSEVISNSSTSETYLNVASKSTTLFQRTLIQSSDNLLTTLSVNKLKEKDLLSFDILHFHSIYNITNISKILELTKKKIVFLTLHDQRMLTGGCHYSGSCTQYLELCGNCPQANRTFWPIVRREKRKINGLINENNIYIVSPSHWLAEKANAASNRRGTEKVRVIRNPVSNMNLNQQKVNRLRFGIDESDLIVGFVSVHLNNPLKGLVDVVNAIKTLPKTLKSRIKLLAVGQGDLSWMPQEIRVIRVVDWKPTEYSIYELMDLLIVPSHQENSPNVIGEALMSGTPVVGSDTGGIAELLREFNFPVFKCGDIEEIRESMEIGLKQKKGEVIQIKAKMMFAYQKVGLEMKEFYDFALKNKG